MVAWTPSTANSDRRGRHVRVFASPLYCRPDGRTWWKIDEALSVVRNESSGSVCVALADDWIVFAPVDNALLQEACDQYVLETRRFGPVLAGGRLPDALSWNVSFSARVRPTADGWQFPCADVRLGVFVTDWLTRFAGRVELRSEGVTLDLAEAKPDAGGKVDLDPETVSPAATPRCLYAEDMFNWNGIRTAATGTIQAQWQAAVDAAGGGQFEHIARSCVRFDTSAYADPVSAVLRVKRQSGTEDPSHIHLSKCAFSVGFDQTSDYRKVYDGYGADPLGVLSAGTGCWERDILTDYEASATFDLGLVEKAHDFDNVDPSGDGNWGALLVKTGDDGPRIVLEMPAAPPGGTSTTTSTAI